MVYKQIGSGVLVSFPPPEDSRPSLLPENPHSPGPIGLCIWGYRQTNGSRGNMLYEVIITYENGETVKFPAQEFDIDLRHTQARPRTNLNKYTRTSIVKGTKPLFISLLRR